MKQFEYKTIKIDSKGSWSLNYDTNEIDTILNKLGAEGWELVNVQDLGVSGTSFSFHYTFKREI
ncbi:DUF4177 domain-containing protein [Flavobacterium sp. xlx-214]|uniref:DUF4177 domain-containing protein n=1 Tax=unclassified Flavobacterium TaxID=196869 RepID=UPI0013D286D0|nr:MULTISPECIES: DUF4177 domain-containing protein [unclassified Flavobacterium]MBA5791979.1 DUF4177 domain-containing protein [Flavobacterium sp. xlx-221]QMI84233.1 DUF4177 domain-containing protein [Flavobacterium sp. xlx-214]